MDWHSRKVLSWRLSNSMDASFCGEALKEALTRYRTAEIFNSDQGPHSSHGLLTPDEAYDAANQHLKAAA